MTLMVLLSKTTNAGTNKKTKRATHVGLLLKKHLSRRRNSRVDKNRLHRVEAHHHHAAPQIRQGRDGLTAEVVSGSAGRKLWPCGKTNHPQRVPHIFGCFPYSDTMPSNVRGLEHHSHSAPLLSFRRRRKDSSHRHGHVMLC